VGRRRQAREIALQALYLVDVAHNPVGEAFAIVNRHAVKEEEKTLDFARTLLEGTVAKCEQIDAHIAATAENWPLKRMAAVDRNVLRLAAFELAYERDTPVGVIIDEAIEIVRKYSSEDATKFINGILDKLQDLRADGAPKSPS